LSEYKEQYTFGMDFGTSDFKFGPITCGDAPRVLRNRGYFPDQESIMMRALNQAPEIVVGDDVPLYLQSSEDLTSRLVYPMRNGVIDRGDDRAWRVVNEISRFGLSMFRPKPEKPFEGFYVVASLSSVSPRYMYESLFEAMARAAKDGLVKAATVISQPFAVAIGHGVTTCVVVESGHGNTQVCPISSYPIRSALVAVNRGGGEANSIAAEILKDLGYGDLAREEAFVRRVKEDLGLLPLDLESAVKAAKANPSKFKAKLKVPGTRVEVDLADKSWQRFLIGEYVFNPQNELFQSYITRGMPRPKDVKIGDTVFEGMIDFGEAIVRSVEHCPVELQPLLYKEILLSGGNFSWQPPDKLRDFATDAPTKMKALLREKGIKGVSVKMTKNPQHSVWHGCIIYGYAVPEDYEWNWERMEGWLPVAA
jgi:crenactin